ncbi:nuclear transport factor 2 family protein [Stenotrophomonas sp. MMGLT7]|uniref:nuclear transport factor 2 family protein n=1 Tax=Stenotrophomonas sp. MMGLT7 TaxID=2901227 RepID=UPI001E40AD7A|nr:nuclear transport factor 2 family protein [Stenotrophomonas sp. MMGLT7]MCD7099930.1 nuclear transport factor 2 family protein [Stenotrophomonas sp. MMGLT7]
MTSPLAGNGKQRIAALFREVLQAPALDLEAVQAYFDPAYVQTVDGTTLDHAGFVAHMRKQKEAIASMEVDFLAMAEDGDTVFTNHVVTATKKDGDTVVVKVIAQFVFKDGRLVRCDELTRLLQGGHDDRDIGSRH